MVDAVIELKDDGGNVRAARAEADDRSPFETRCLVFAREALDEIAREAGVRAFTSFFDDTAFDRADRGGGAWLSAVDGLATVEALIRHFEWFAPGEASFTEGETIRGVPAAGIYEDLRVVRSILKAAAARGEVFRFVVYD
jgi:hypothetical protein